MKIVNTSEWLYPPQSGTSFRVGYLYFRCWFRIGPYALVQEIKDSRYD